MPELLGEQKESPRSTMIRAAWATAALRARHAVVGYRPLPTLILIGWLSMVNR